MSKPSPINIGYVGETFPERHARQRAQEGKYFASSGSCLCVKGPLVVVGTAALLGVNGFAFSGHADFGTPCLRRSAMVLGVCVRANCIDQPKPTDRRIECERVSSGGGASG